MDPVVLVGVIIVVLYIFSCINILAEYERGVVFRLGRVQRGRKAPAWCSSSGLLTGWCACRCGWKRWRCRRRTS